MSSNEDWLTDANDALHLSLVSPTATGVKPVGASFHPKFTYPLFGEGERIFGYQNLQINLQYNATDMRPNVTIAYSKKTPAVGDTEADDIKSILSDFLPEVAFQKKADFETAIKSLRDDWSPPGQRVATFSNVNAAFEVWKGSLADPAVKQLVKRIQILVPLFIEGGTAISVDEPDSDRWTVFFLYQKRAPAADADGPSYVFAGYCTVYRFFHMQPPTPPRSPKQGDVAEPTLGGDFDLALLPCRTRISQFIIIPPFQQQGLGPRLYSAIFKEYIKHPQTVEITVEDPNEAFDDLRDIADLQYLRQLPEFQDLCINTSVVIPKAGPAPGNIVDKAACDSVRAKAKMAPRQFARVLEMHLMSKLPEPVRQGIVPDETAARATEKEKHEYRLWKLLVKKRVYKQNKDALGELDIPERIDKLEQTVSTVEFDYARLLIKAEEQQNKLFANGPSNGKRKADEDGELPVNKKARVEDVPEEE